MEDYSKYVYGIKDPEIIAQENRFINELLDACDGRYPKRRKADPAGAAEELFNNVKKFINHFNN